MRTLFLMLLLTGSVAAQDITDGLVAWWPFEDVSGTTPDRIGGNTGTLNNAPVTLRGVVGGALSFSRPSSQSITAVGYKGITGTAARSVTLWFSTTDTATTANGVIGWGNQTGSPAGTGWNISVENGVVWQRGLLTTGNWGSGFNNDRWHFLAMTFPSGGTMNQVRVWVNANELSGTFSSGSTALNTTSDSDVRLGFIRTGSPADWYFNGYLDDIRIYNRALTAGEIAEIYNAGRQPIYGGE